MNKDLYLNNLQSKVAHLNEKTYCHAAAKRLYTQQKWLPAEASILLDYSSDIVSKKVLELGAGSGRIASVLKHRAADYCATDINYNMITTLREVHPDVKAMVADARTLEGFNDCEYDTIIFSFNGIDCLPFHERPVALSSIYRVLTSGGAFIHSTHNVFHARSASYHPKLFNSEGSFADFCLRKWNRWKIARYEYYSPEYAIVNDRSLQNGLLNVYVRPEIHIAQLTDAGFSIDAIYERSGYKLERGNLPTDQWFYVVARKQ
ncbi:MAG: class I SAM-dependent methyltransferase [Sphingobacteriia bacterium]|nr:class I SAM-dependent methyltransferase [Sphingobacteriia bacterium]